MNTVRTRPGTRLHGRPLTIARAGWILMAVLTLSLYAGAFALRLFQHGHGVSGVQAAYSIQDLILNLLFTSVFVAISLVIYWRRSDDWMALFVSIGLLAFGTAGFTDFPHVLGLAFPLLRLPTTLVAALGTVFFGIFFYLFPNGRFVPHWTRWLAFVWIAIMVSSILFPGSLLDNTHWPPALAGILLSGFILTFILAQVHRYRHYSNWTERQQTKWVVFGLALGMGGFFVLRNIGLVAPVLATSWLRELGGMLFILLVPLSIGVAILRSHLWEIDVLIHRTISYTVLTGLLALIYYGIVVLLQGVFSLFSDQHSTVTIVLSTLTIAVLFAPVRRRVQSFIDRRFYRRKYNAAKTLASFAATARDEVVLEALAAEMLRIIEQTMQPQHLSLFLLTPTYSKAKPSQPSEARKQSTARAGK